MSQVKKIRDNEWLIEVQEDGETKEMYIQLPPESLTQMGWCEDDILTWSLTDNGVTITKKKDQVKTVSIINRNNGMVSEMTFDDNKQLDRWLELNEDWENLGELEAELPTRHVRMQGKEKDNNET
jgi:hypothetical protein